MAEDKTAIATQTKPGALEKAPDYLKKGARGFEDTVQSDVSIPRIGLTQANSPEVTDGDPRRIPDMVVGDMFNSVTKQNYGKRIVVQLLRKMPLRAMEFRSIDDGGGVIDPNVPLNDERLKWGNSGDKKADRPKATLFRDFLVRLIHDDGSRELIALSFKVSGIKAAKELWGLAMGRNRDCFAGLYEITTDTKLDPKPHKIYKPANFGWASQADAVAGEELMEAMSNIKGDQIDRSGDDGHDDPDNFDPAAYEAEGAGKRHDPGM